MICFNALSKIAALIPYNDVDEDRSRGIPFNITSIENDRYGDLLRSTVAPGGGAAGGGGLDRAILGGYSRDDFYVSYKPELGTIPTNAYLMFGGRDDINLDPVRTEKEVEGIHCI